MIIRSTWCKFSYPLVQLYSVVHALVLQAGQQSIHVLLTLKSNSENKKPCLFQTEKDLCKNIHQASTPLFPVPGWGTSGPHLAKIWWNKSSFSSHQQALHCLPPCCCWCIAGCHRGMQPGCESPPMPTEKGISRLYASVTEHTARPLRTSKCMKVQIQFISFYISK